MARKGFEGFPATECRPLGRRLISLSNHVERIGWPKGLVEDLRQASAVLEIITEDAEEDERG